MSNRPKRPKNSDLQYQSSNTFPHLQSKLNTPEEYGEPQQRPKNSDLQYQSSNTFPHLQSKLNNFEEYSPQQNDDTDTSPRFEQDRGSSPNLEQDNNPNLVPQTEHKKEEEPQTDEDMDVPASGLNNNFILQAQAATETIREDIRETTFILRNHAANTTELLHLVEHWLTLIYFEFKSQQERIKLTMQKKWLAGDLKGERADVGMRKKNLLNSIVTIEQWKKEKLNFSIEQLSKTYSRSSEGHLEVDSDALKKELDLFLDELKKINQHISEIGNYQTGQKNSEPDKKASHSVGLQQQLQETFKFIQKLKELNQKDIFTVVVLGLEKAGKTTFINALLNDDILPTDPERCTQVLTVISKSLSPNASAVVEFYTTNEFTDNLKQKRKDDQLTEKQIKDVCDSYIGSQPLRLDSNPGSEEKFSKKLKDFIADPHYMYVVKKVTIYTNRLEAEVKFEIIDAPGFDSPLKEHRIAVSKAISEADAFVLLMSGQRPSLTEPQIQVLNEILGQHYDAMSKAFAGITWLDQNHTKEKYKEHLVKCTNELLKFNFKEDNIFPICSKIRLLSRSSDSEELEKILQKAQQFDRLAEGYEDLEYALKYAVKNELPVKRAQQAIELAQRKILPNVNTAITLGRHIIPDFISEDKMLESEIESGNVEQWSEIFFKKRLKPTVEAALRWKK